jgi:hypothetical protein
MSLRSWAIRGLILAGLGAIGAFIWLANSWVSPERIRAEVKRTLEAQLEGVDIHVGAARMRILGGIAVSDLTLTLKGGDSPILAVPAAVLYHDKEQLNHGHLVIKKIELDKAELTLERSPAGKWNVEGIFKDGPADKPVPTFLIKDARVHVVDRGPDPLPEVNLTIDQLTLLNDPIPVLAIQAHASARKFGSIKATARLDRIKGELMLGLELPEFQLGEVVAGNADRFAPGLSRHLAGLNAVASIKADLTYNPSSEKSRQWSHKIDVELKEARYLHPDLPWPVEQIAAVVHIVDGRVSVDDATARVGEAQLKLGLESRAGAAPAAPDDSGDPLAQFESRLASLELTITGLTLNDRLYRVLPEPAQRKWRQFAPEGKVNASYKFTRGRDLSGWQREFELRPNQATMCYEKFKYPVTDVCGSVKWALKSAGSPVTNIRLDGTAAGQKITISGQIAGEGPDPGINLKVVGVNVPIDDKLVAAIPDKFRDLVRKFRANGRGDFMADFVQEQGVNLCMNEFRIDVQDARLCHEDIPYPVEKVKGRLFVRSSAMDPDRPVRPGRALGEDPDRDEIIIDGFTAVHGGSIITLNGSKQPIPRTHDKKLVLHFTGVNCPADADLQATCRSLRIESLWTTFQPHGKLSFNADLDLIDRGSLPNQPGRALPFDPRTDLDLKMGFKGAAVTPTFFPYEVTDFAGNLHYMGGCVNLWELTGRHGDSRVRLDAGDVRFYPDGAVWANLGGLQVKPLIADAAFIKALPAKLGAGVTEMSIKGRTELTIKQLVVLTPPDAPSAQTRTPPRTSDPLSTSLYEGQPSAQAPVTPSSLEKSSSSAVQRPPLAGAGLPPSQTPYPPAHPAEPDPKIYWDLELKLIGASFDTGVVWDQAFGSIESRGIYEGTHMGLIRGALWLESTAIAGQPVTRISGRYNAPPQLADPLHPGEYFPMELEFTDLTGELFHGVLGGEAHVSLTSPVRFNLLLKAADVQLEDVAKHYLTKLGADADLKGIAQAQLRLHNRVDLATGQLVIEGWGVVDVPTGRMYNLPILLDLVKLLKFEQPNKTAFEEAHAKFRIQGDRVRVEQIDLIGRAVCLGGSGELDVSGNYVKFDFYTIFSEVLAQLINTPVGDLTAFLSKNLFTIKLTRENGELRYKPVFVQKVSEPASEVADRLRMRVARLFGAAK